MIPRHGLPLSCTALKLSFPASGRWRVTSNANIQPFYPQCQGLSLAALHPSKRQLHGPQGEWRLEPAQPSCMERELGLTAKHPSSPICSLVGRGGIQEVWSGSTPISKVSIAVLPWLLLGSLVWIIAMAAIEALQASGGPGLMLVTGKPLSLFGI